MAAQRAERGASPSPADRSTLGAIALALTAVSVAGFVVLIVGSVLDWRGFSDDPDDTSTFGDVVWSVFAIAGILALLTGIVAWVRGRSRRWAGDVGAGRVAVGWFVLAILISVVVSALD